MYHRINERVLPFNRLLETAAFDEAPYPMNRSSHYVVFKPRAAITKRNPEFQDSEPFPLLQA